MGAPSENCRAENAAELREYCARALHVTREARRAALLDVGVLAHDGVPARRSVSARGRRRRWCTSTAAGGAGGAAGGACGGGLGGSRGNKKPRRAGDAGLQRERPGFGSSCPQTRRTRRIVERRARRAAVVDRRGGQRLVVQVGAGALDVRVGERAREAYSVHGPGGATGGGCDGGAGGATGDGGGGGSRRPTAGGQPVRPAAGATACQRSLLEVAAAEVDEAGARRQRGAAGAASSADDTSFITLPPMPSPTSSVSGSGASTPCTATARRAAPVATAARRRHRARACRTSSRRSCRATSRTRGASGRSCRRAATSSSSRRRRSLGGHTAVVHASPSSETCRS